jgi:hypothetical protein
MSALSCFERASALEPSWDDPRRHKRMMVKKLQQVQSLIEMKGKLKTKRFNALVEALNKSGDQGRKSQNLKT